MDNNSLKTQKNNQCKLEECDDEDFTSTGQNQTQLVRGNSEQNVQKKDETSMNQQKIPENKNQSSIQLSNVNSRTSSSMTFQPASTANQESSGKNSKDEMSSKGMQKNLLDCIEQYEEEYASSSPNTVKTQICIQRADSHAASDMSQNLNKSSADIESMTQDELHKLQLKIAQQLKKQEKQSFTTMPTGEASDQQLQFVFLHASPNIIKDFDHSR